jgi:Ankyrin repeats (3 copies)/AAA domain (dynein-related subfamily)/Ankyrin repeat
MNLFGKKYYPRIDFDTDHALYSVCSRSGEFVSLASQILSSDQTTLLKDQIAYRDVHGNTALIMAAANGHVSILKLLLADRRVKQEHINHENMRGETALMMASGQGYAKTLKLLLEDGRVEEKHIKRENNDGDTALSRAAENGHEHTLSVLLAHPCVEANHINHQNRYGNTALISAATAGHESIVNFLLEDERVNMRIRNKFMETAMTYAKQKSFSPETIAKLEAAGCELELGAAAAAAAAAAVVSPSSPYTDILDLKEAAPQMSTPEYDCLRLAIPPSGDSKTAPSEHTVYIVPKNAIDPFAATNASNAIDQLFHQITKTPWLPVRPIVIGIFGNPGCGKNVLVRRFALRLWQHCKEHNQLKLDENHNQIPYETFYAEHNCAPMTTVESLSKFMGASRGIKGGEGDLVRQIRAGAQVFCLDELDKAHHTIVKSCGSLFEDGYLNDNSSNTVVCRPPTFFFILGNAKQGTDQVRLMSELENMEAFHDKKYTENQLKSSHPDVRKKLKKFRKAMFPGDFEFIGSRCHSVLLQYKSRDPLYYQKLALRHVQDAVKQMGKRYESCHTRVGWTAEVLLDATSLLKQEIKTTDNRELRGRILNATVNAWPNDEDESVLLQRKFSAGGHVMILCREQSDHKRHAENKSSPFAWRFVCLEETDEVRDFCADIDRHSEDEAMPKSIEQLLAEQEQRQQHNAVFENADADAGGAIGPGGGGGGGRGSDIEIDYKHARGGKDKDARARSTGRPTLASVVADLGKVCADGSQALADTLHIDACLIRWALTILVLALLIIKLI